MYGTTIPAPSTTDIPFDQPAIDTVAPAAEYPETTTPAIEPAAVAAPEVPQVYAFVKEIVPAGGYQPDAEKLEFDVILSVSCDSKNATLVKRIAFCKHQLAQELAASDSKPITMVEDVKPHDDLAKRLRTLCSY